MAARPAISKGEMEVARVLWTLGKATVREVHEAFPEKKRIDFTTVQTYLRRLEEKGYLQVKLRGRVRVYSPRVKPRTVIRETIDDLIDRLFGGEAFPLMKHLVERGFSPDELDQLKQLVNRLEEESDDKRKQ